MSKSPAFQFYPSDFLSGTVAMFSLEETGLYSVLLAFDWSLNGLPKDVEKLARLTRTSRRKFRALWTNVSACFVERDGRYFNPRLELERSRQAEWREKSAKGGRANGSRVVQPPIQPNTQPNGNTMSLSVSVPVGTTTASRKPRAVPPDAVAVPKATVAAGTGTWIAPYFDAWVAQYGGKPAVGPMLKVFKVLEADHGAEETLRRWKIYLSRTEARFNPNPAKFSQTWGEWDRAVVPKVDPLDKEIADFIEWNKAAYAEGTKGKDMVKFAARVAAGNAAYPQPVLRTEVAP